MVRLIDFEHDSAGNLIGVTVEYDGEIIVLERVRHGRWNSWHGDKRMKNGEYRHFHYHACDQCECRTAIASNFCSNCGAKMDGGAEDA